MPKIIIPITIVENNIVLPINSGTLFSAANNFEVRIAEIVVGIKAKLIILIASIATI